MWVWVRDHRDWSRSRSRTVTITLVTVIVTHLKTPHVIVTESPITVSHDQDVDGDIRDEQALHPPSYPSLLTHNVGDFMVSVLISFQHANLSSIRSSLKEINRYYSIIDKWS